MRRAAGYFARDARGGAMVEFGLVAPLLVAVFIGIASGGILILKYNAAHTAVSSAGLYLMAGGTNLEAARQAALSAWPGASGAAQVTATRDCRCGATVASCSVLCADANPPRTFVTLSASDVVDTGFSHKVISVREEVRVR